MQLSSAREVTDIFELLQREGASESRFGPRICAALLPVLIMKIDECAVPYGAVDSRALERRNRDANRASTTAVSAPPAKVAAIRVAKP